MILAVFVYGTLKTGQCRAPLWPAVPESIDDAWTGGSLFGRDDYPALRPGKDRVLGQLWRFAPDQMDRVIEALDQIEGTNQPGQPDLYVRATVDIWSLDDRRLVQAFTYHYAKDPTHDGFVLIEPDENGWVWWAEDL